MRPATRTLRATFTALAAAATLTTGACMSADAANEPTHLHHSVDYVEFTVKDLSEAKRFFGAAFGWTFQDYGPEYVGLRRSDGLEFGGLLLADEVRTGGPLVVLFSTDLEASLRAVRQAGGRIVKEPFDFPGGRRFHFEDPSGNELAIWAEPAG